MATSARALKIAANQLKLRATIWPTLEVARLWDRTKKNGFATVPRTLPLICEILDALTKGKPVAKTYLELWCRVRDEGFVVLNKKEEQAFHAGFRGDRAVTMWKERMRALAKLGFIDIQPGSGSDLGYALIWNPYLVIKDLKMKSGSGIPMDVYNALVHRSSELDANELT
jgi:hypothetical protein